MAKDAKATQKKSSNKSNVKESNKKVVKKTNVEEKKDTKKKVNSKPVKKVVEKEIIKDEPIKIEEKVKEDKKILKTEKKNRTIDFLGKMNNDNIWKGTLIFVGGFLIATFLFRCILWPDRIATLKDGTQPIVKIDKKTFTADDLYESLKEGLSSNTLTILLNDIDEAILVEKYKEDSEMNNDVKSTAEYYYSAYEQNYGYTKEEFLSKYGFASESDFLDSLKLDYRRNKYYEAYALGLVTEKEIEKYYKDEVFGDVDSKHMLVSIDSENGLSDEEAKKLANEIIAKLNKGTSWDDVKEEYKDKIISEELGYNAFNASLEKAYLKECKDLAVGTYSKTPVLTSYGYHIVYKIAQKDKPELDDVKDEVKDILATQKKNADENLYYKSLIKMREDAKIEFTDTKIEDLYNNYKKSYK